MNEKRKNGVLFLTFGAIYFILETLYKGHLTHWSMFVLGGVLGVLIGGLNEYLPWELPFWRQCLYGMILVTLMEATTGFVLNIMLNLNVWDYSNSFIPFFFNQCCVSFSCLWYILSGVCIVLDDYLRFKWYGEQFPTYIFDRL